MGKHNSAHVNDGDPSNLVKDENIDVLFVQRETVYNLHSLMTVLRNTGWTTKTVPDLALISCNAVNSYPLNVCQ